MTRRLRLSVHQLAVPRTQWCARDGAFDVASPKLWNTLPDHVKLADSSNNFEKRMKTFLIMEHFTTDFFKFLV